MSADAKRALRREARARRASAYRDQGPAAARAVADRLSRLTLPAEAEIAGYWPLRDELDPRPALLALAARGYRIALPVVVARGLPLIFRRWRPDEALAPDGQGLEAPPPGAPEVAPDVLLVPLLAFDGRGHRLGYGAGYYDRTLAALRARRPILALGLAFAAQEVARLPAEPHDHPLDAIVTERAVLWCAPDKEAG